MARPTVMTSEVLEKLKQAFLIGCCDMEACLFAGISKQTLYNYQDKTEGYVDQKEQWKENPILKARQTVMNDINSPETAKWYLERKKKAEFSTRQESTGADGKDLITTFMADCRNKTAGLPKDDEQA